MHFARPRPAAAAPAIRPKGSAAGDSNLAAELIAGLSAPSPSINPKFLYDRLGCRLFDAITELPEYYPTRVERELLGRHAADIAARAGNHPTIVDLGAGSGEKACLLLEPMSPAQYVALDISPDFLDAALTTVSRSHPGIITLALAADLTRPLRLPVAVRREGRTFTFYGSSIGNFAPEDARRLLEDIRRNIHGEGGLVIGIDLVKPRGILEAAYDDALGVTAAFNLNVLNNVNALLGADFRVPDWRHRATYDPARARVQMHLEATRDLVVRWPGGERRFVRGERIHTENSHKYRLPAFRASLQAAGFDDVQAWTDAGNRFALLHARCRP